MKFCSQELFSLPRNLRAGIVTIDRQKRYLLPDKEYYAVVYDIYSQQNAAVGRRCHSVVDGLMLEAGLENIFTGHPP